ncbi:tryptophan-rich sensory protein TspO [Rubellimicrobium aerolatum]|uniref:TspO/MBR family protein n=1 Tax=Rubellimicrobium aerolatum TaxID=490979 RepID=A0ABW0SB18_9RHOB|nr:TspO/MBR family protein [Rubellimicrobium aerolatum]MBP1805367.1 tryptophan-rich sensory protein [Rubellimicrobium aerolatum]
MLLFLIFLLACLCAGLTGYLFPTGDWYARLRKPDWTPPNWAFPVAWTTLYLFMAIAGARVATLGGPGATTALAFWALQIAANTLWTPTVFGQRRLRLGLAVIGLLWLAVLGATVAHWRVSTLAGLLFVPYLAWVSVAAALNAALIRLNPDEAR